MRDKNQRNHKERKEVQKNKRSWLPLIQVDKYGDPLSNFLNNFLRQFKNAKGLNLMRFFNLMAKKQNERSSKSIMGGTKTLISPAENKGHLNQNIYRNRSLKQENLSQSNHSILNKTNKSKLRF